MRCILLCNQNEFQVSVILRREKGDEIGFEQSIPLCLHLVSSMSHVSEKSSCDTVLKKHRPQGTSLTSFRSESSSGQDIKMVSLNYHMY